MKLMAIEFDNQPGIFKDKIDAVSCVIFNVPEPMLSLDKVRQLTKLA